MFKVNRYDPDAQKKGKKKRPRSSFRSDDGDPSKEVGGKKKSSLHVIADETEAPKQLKSHATQEEIDDFDLIELDEEQSKLPSSSADIQLDDDHDEVQTAIRAAEMPIDEVAKRWRIAPFLIDNLKRDGFERFYPIQALSIPDVIASERHSHVRAQDICITAPTGSGKTLSYVLPILNSLATKYGPRRLRALVILPSRDLATQVFQVFQSYVKGSNLKVGLAIGQTDFSAEQVTLCLAENSNNLDMGRTCLSQDPGNLDLAMRLFRNSSSSLTLGSRRIPASGWTNVDILVCTPGRLVDHMDNTPGFTLQHLRFLVVDEADRLLSQSYQNWIDRVLDSTQSATLKAYEQMTNNQLLPLQLSDDQCSYRLEPITWRRIDENNSNKNDALSVSQSVQLRKMLVSATLTRDPRKLSALRLVNPKHIDVHQLKSGGSTLKYSMPAELEECTVECTAEQKPLVLLSLLLERKQKKQDEKSVMVVFTSSIDSTHRLARLLQLLWAKLDYSEGCIGEFSSALNQNERSALMKQCKDPKDSLSVIVCSDGMSRGMDLDFVDAVINYDVPSLAKTYVHRCGRTARASRKGTAISLLKGGQVAQFNRMRKLIQDSGRVKSIPIKKSLIRNAVAAYKLCIAALKDVLDAEANGELGHAEFLYEYVPDGRNDNNSNS